MTGTDPLALSAGELWEQQNEQAREALNELARSTTQREWLQITHRLDRSRVQIGEDHGLTLLAMAYVKGVREHGGAQWDRLLDMTDAQLQDVHGFAAGDRPDDTPAPAGDDQVQEVERVEHNDDPL